MNTKLCTLSALLALAFDSYAQQVQTNALPEVTVKATADDNSGYRPKNSSAATKIDVPLRDVPQTVNTVTKQVMRDQNALSLQDALQNVAGLSFSLGDAQRDQVIIRGFSAITDQFIDGVRDDALYFRDLSNVERVEVLKGPASVLYGRGSAGGIVNRVTKKPSEDPVSEIGLTVGSEGQKRSEFDVGRNSADGTLLFRLTGAVEDSSSFRNQYFLERQALSPSLTYKPDAQTSFTAQFNYLHDRRLADQGIPSYRGRPADVPIATYYGAANGRDRAFVQSEVKDATFTLDHKFSEKLAWRSVLRTYDFDLDRNYTTISRVTQTANPTVTIAQAHRQRAERGLFWQNELTQKLQLAGMHHELLYGVEYSWQNKTDWQVTRNNAATYSLFNPVLANLSPIAANAVPNINAETRINTLATYVQDLISLTPQWKLLAGLRYERLSQDRDDRVAKSSLNRVDTPLSPRVGLVYQPDERTSLYAGYSRSFQPLADSFVFYGNSAQLEPTKTESKEVGIKYELNDKTSLTAALFEMTQNNIQVADPNRPGFAINVGQQRTRGVELSASGELAPHWNLIAGYAYMNGLIVQSSGLTSAGTPFQGNVSSLTPRHTFNLWLKRDLPDGYWVAAGARAESARFASSDNLTVLPGYAVINLGAGYVAEKFDVTLSLKNLLDRSYFISAHSAANDYNMPGEPRSLLVSTRYRF
ncbi:TonB-dependent receptor [Herbaspirillum huttiense]|uniref:TonB-dependent receptor n=1 Tax=Herbaspirillum huttiense TaxID=863372 RepID=UPI00381B1B2B